MTVMTITGALDAVANWTRLFVAPRLEFKVEPEGGRVEGYEVKTAHPSVHVLFTPTEERMPEGELAEPSITVQVTAGTDGPRGERTFSVRLLLRVWAEGHFAAEDGRYVRSQDGWRDLFNGLDRMAAAVEDARTVGGMAVDMKKGVRYALYDIDGAIPDLYPHWMGYVDFELVAAPPASRRFEDLL